MKEKLSELSLGIKRYCKEYINDIKDIKWEKAFEFVKKRKVSLMVVVLAVFLILGYSYGTVITSKGRALKTLEISLKNGKERKARKVIRINDKEVEKGRLTPYLQYYNGEGSKVDSLIKELQTAGKSVHAELKSTKKFLGEDYYINLKVYNLKVDSNYKEGTIYINESEQISPGETLRGLVPGKYNIRGVLSTEFGEIVESNEYVVDKDEITEINFKASEINLVSNFEDAEVFVNDTKTDFKVSDIKEFGPIPQDGSVSIRVEKELPWGRVKSEDVAVKDIENIKLTLDVKTDKLQEEVFEVVEKFYISVFDALNEGKKELITNATEGAKDKIYEELERKYFIFKNNYELIESLNDSDKNVFEYKDGVYRGTVVIDMDYEVSKVFLGLNKESKNKKFFTNVIYKDGEWKVENVENFSL